MSETRMVAKGVVWFEDSKPIHRLMRSQCSATRSAYQAAHKHHLRGNDVKVYVKRNYMDELNQRYVSDAVSRASSIRHENVIFGGRKSWDDLRSGILSKDDWKALRDDQLYSRGDATKSGNPNLRIVGEELWVNDPSGRGSWIRGRLFIPEKFAVDPHCYDVRLTTRLDGRFDVVVTWEQEVEMIEVVAGSIGVDVNPNGIALAEVDGDGNLMSHTFLTNDRIRFASRDKRDMDVRLLAIEVVDAALAARKSIVVEELSFKRRRKGKHFNRMASNFLHRKMLDAIRRRAARSGVPIIEVNPAFTSQLGLLKYAEVYSLNRHSAAAFVIARRGLGITEAQTFEDPKPTGKREKLNLEGRGFSCELSPKAWGWLKDKFLRPKTSVLTGPAPMSTGRPEGQSPSDRSVGKRVKPGWDSPGRVANNCSATKAAFAASDS